MPETNAAAPELPSSPKATNSGFTRPSCAGPFELKAATMEKESVAPTVRIFLAILKLPVRFAKPFMPE
ncbi:hypothetical protein D3C83_121230 [compost metagenome]